MTHTDMHVCGFQRTYEAFPYRDLQGKGLVVHQLYATL